MTTARVIDDVYPALTPAEGAAIDQYLAETCQDRGTTTRMTWEALRRLDEAIDPPGCTTDAVNFLYGQAMDLLELIASSDAPARAGNEEVATPGSRPDRDRDSGDSPSPLRRPPSHPEPGDDR